MRQVSANGTQLIKLGGNFKWYFTWELIDSEEAIEQNQFVYSYVLTNT